MKAGSHGRVRWYVSNSNDQNTHYHEGVIHEIDYIEIREDAFFPITTIVAYGSDKKMKRELYLKYKKASREY